MKKIYAINGSPRRNRNTASFYAFNTYQFDDYDKYVCEVFSKEEKAAYREKHFPEDCRKAFAMGVQLIKNA